jgi:hypothetical protein
MSESTKLGYILSIIQLADLRTHLTTSDGKGRIASTYHNYATDRPKSIEITRDNA